MQHARRVANRQELLLLLLGPGPKPDTSDVPAAHPHRLHGLVGLGGEVPDVNLAAALGDVHDARPGRGEGTHGQVNIRRRRREDGHPRSLREQLERPVAHRQRHVREERRPLQAPDRPLVEVGHHPGRVHRNRLVVLTHLEVALRNLARHARRPERGLTGVEVDEVERDGL